MYFVPDLGKNYISMYLHFSRSEIQSLYHENRLMTNILPSGTTVDPSSLHEASEKQQVRFVLHDIL